MKKIRNKAYWEQKHKTSSTTIPQKMTAEGEHVSATFINHSDNPNVKLDQFGLTESTLELDEKGRLQMKIRRSK